MIRITYIGNFLSRHGLNPTYSESLVPQLAGQNYSIRVASRRLNPFLRMADMVLAVLSTPGQNACVILDLCSGPRAFPAADLVARICDLTGKPYVVVLHGGTLPHLLKTSRRRLLRLLQRAQRVVSPSKYLAETFAGHVDVEVIPNAVNIENYPFRHRTSLQPNFLYLRAFHRNYGPITAIKAFSIVRQQYPNARLMMVGPEIDNVLGECQLLVTELGLQGHIEFLDRVPKTKIPELGSRCDIFINPTFVDNTPVSVVEAMAMGMCLIATNVGGLPYLLEDGQTALLVQPGDERAMASAMLRLLRDPELACSLSERARATAEAMDWSSVIPKWVQVINGAAV
jgi:glycosyltransferase involved in cell wall biosynthesis